ncbi:hypothetical protein MTBLM5_60155 [Magnetospirillum sp. LM-5]|nr:hypothetical protein MTBLM5_60155 [Magnetospirillum sp. LM-5]
MVVMASSERNDLGRRTLLPLPLAGEGRGEGLFPRAGALAGKPSPVSAAPSHPLPHAGEEI